MKVLNVEEFNDIVIEGKKTVLVDFFATWCGPCKMLSPILEQVEKESQSKVEIYKVDVDNAFEIAKSYGVMSVPTLILFKNGVEAKRAIGLKNKDFIIDFIKE